MKEGPPEDFTGPGEWMSRTQWQLAFETLRRAFLKAVEAGPERRSERAGDGWSLAF